MQMNCKRNRTIYLFYQIPQKFSKKKHAEGILKEIAQPNFIRITEIPKENNQEVSKKFPKIFLDMYPNKFARVDDRFSKAILTKFTKQLLSRNFHRKNQISSKIYCRQNV